MLFGVLVLLDAVLSVDCKLKVNATALV